MVSYYPELAERVRRQSELMPELYGSIDFSHQPYRLATEPDARSALPTWMADRAPLLANERLVELISTATMLADGAADPYAALTATHSVSHLIGMLRTACQQGIDAVPDAPPELVEFISAMEVKPDWIDFDLIEAGARQYRVPAALLSPFTMRGAFIATFTNTYAALPMAMTGALSGRRAARRVNETTSFFAVTTLPGALDRYGPGFEAAAMVRLMHSMVRVNALQRSGLWDVDVYGMPVPQVDQMPAGLIATYIVATMARRSGRTEFNQSERAMVEFTRYRNFLIGLPKELLPETPDDIIDLIHTRAALLRDGFDDATCGELLRATMDAYLRPGTSLFDRIADAVEKSYSKAAFIRAYFNGDRAAAKAIGVTIGPSDLVRIGVTAPFIGGRFLVVRQASRSTALQRFVDPYLTALVKKRLVTYGKPEYTTDAAHYTPAGH
ncbi:hypothetical protein A5669_05040 [Mycolicibacterium fortuitum]|uniref:oxygenase MpaB family protein n=1 Tax=Mycolicibacterium fortuitum TaxID=1766 RepID=UPI0007EB757D|nr:oxygenase MpaB family protein [Mycolicibacterium fortuitum]OBG47684.1 hypothetical protein A5669_05040 [Mycolicibacterium fortuitum]